MGGMVFVEIFLGFDPALTLRALNEGWEVLGRSLSVTVKPPDGSGGWF